ncbi:hypothetical protein [Nocardia otitidiscaviarum]|nr:hypothetical protein [Nocardia otitidiscaviarum]
MTRTLADMVGPVVAGMWGCVDWQAIADAISTEFDAAKENHDE